MGLIRIWIAACLCAAATAAVAAPPEPCGPADELRGILAQEFDEQRRFVGIAGGAGRVELWHNADTGSWTILTVRPGGRACVAALGAAGAIAPAADEAI